MQHRHPTPEEIAANRKAFKSGLLWLLLPILGVAFWAGSHVVTAAMRGTDDTPGQYRVGDVDTHRRIAAMTDCAELRLIWQRGENAGDTRYAAVAEAYGVTARLRMLEIGCAR